MEESTRQFLDSPGVRVGIKLGILVGLVLILLIPLMMIQGLVGERAGRSREVAEELISRNGGRQDLTTPRLIIPYVYRTGEEQTSVRRFVTVVPETVAVNATIVPEVRSRGIYEAPVFTAELSIQGMIAPPELTPLTGPGGEAVTVEWEAAELVTGLERVQGVRRAPVIRINDRLEEAQSASSTSAGAPGIRVPVTEAQNGLTFSIDIALSGGGSLFVTPLANDASLRMSSSWPDPSFGGAILPEFRTITDEGFDARWSSTAIGTGLPRSWTTGANEPSRYGLRMGVNLYQPVSSYQLTERSVKYGVLFILLPFVALFLLETFTGVRVHPLQYLLVAAAKVVFYLLLLSLSEHLPFSLAYWAGAAATTLLLMSYVLAFARERIHAIGLAGMVTLEYLFLFAALQSQDYALLIGSVGLFVVIGTVMLATRRVNWYEARRAEPV